MGETHACSMHAWVARVLMHVSGNAWLRSSFHALPGECMRTHAGIQAGMGVATPHAFLRPCMVSLMHARTCMASPCIIVGMHGHSGVPGQKSSFSFKEIGRSTVGIRRESGSRARNHDCPLRKLKDKRWGSPPFRPLAMLEKSPKCGKRASRLATRPAPGAISSTYANGTRHRCPRFAGVRPPRGVYM